MSIAKSSDHVSGKAFRTSEIAAAVGVHPNTVRLYEEWGYLPLIPRGANGYRQFNDGHMAQMRFVRLALSDPYPGRNLRQSLASLVRFAALGNLNEALEAARKHRLLVRDELVQAESAAGFLEQWVCDLPPDCGDATGLRSGEAAEQVAVTKDTLRHWERNGLISPPRDPGNGYRRYGRAEIGRLRVLRMLTRAGYSTMAVLRMIRQLDHGRKEGLAGVLDTPQGDEDLLYASDRWLTTLRVHEQRSGAIIEQLETMRSVAASR